MSLNYEPSSEPLHISATQVFLNWEMSCVWAMPNPGRECTMTRPDHSSVEGLEARLVFAAPDMSREARLSEIAHYSKAS